MCLVFAMGHQKSPKYDIKWPKLMFLAIINALELKLFEDLGS